jgi:UDP-N-acetylglucosamine--N-acetylmuramyl-(pentapeptide) pyrophosphoryl-undecaprenol N-acetylglucosamine transferase
MAALHRILIATGGSGGHLFPALAVAEELENRWPESVVEFTGTGREVETSIFAAAGRLMTVLPLVATSEAGRRPIAFAATWWKARRQSKSILQKLRPACVIGTGGFSMTPVVSAALATRTPVILLEQNAVPGRATRRYAGSAAAVCASFPTFSQPLASSAKVEFTGNPVRQAIARLVDSDRPPEGALLVLGGSQGARGLNDAMLVIAASHPTVLEGRRVFHQTGGEESAHQLASAYAAAKIDATVRPFFDDMAGIYQQSAIAIARAGATTLAELACAGIPAILVPYPYAKDDHQQANARFFADYGAAALVTQSTDAGQTAADLARELTRYGDRELRSRNAVSMHSLATPRAARNVIDLIERCISREH